MSSSEEKSVARDTVSAPSTDTEPDSSVIDKKDVSAEEKEKAIDVNEVVLDEDKTMEEEKGEKDTEESKEDKALEDDVETSEKNTNVASPDSTSAKISNKTPRLSATLREAKEILGSKALGRTRSQDRKRSLKRVSASPVTTPNRQRSGRPSKRRKQ